MKVAMFKLKMKAFAKAAEELNDAWDAVDGNQEVANAIDGEFPFKKDLYYEALRDAVVWAEKTAKNLD